MAYTLKIPNKGIERFQLVREIGDMEYVTVLLGEESYELHLEEIKIWLRLVGCTMIDKLLDYAWNYRVMDYDLTRQHMQVNPDQRNPLEIDLPPLPPGAELRLQQRGRSRRLDPFGDQMRRVPIGGF